MNHREEHISTAEILAFLRENRKFIGKNFSVKEIALFGSFARGEYTSESDIDIIVDFDEHNFDNYINLVFFLEEGFHRHVQLIAKGPQLTPAFLRNIQTDLLYV